jgi:CRISPR-associated protein Csc2
MTFKSLEAYQRYFVEAIPSTPTNRYVSVIMLRETKSYAIFTTEGGEQQDVEETQAGLSHSGSSISRLVMFKRKQVAPERRTGKALLRQYGIFPYAILLRSQGQEKVVEEVAYGEDEIAEAEKQAKKKSRSLAGPYSNCYLIRKLCTHCPDCLTYGYAAIEGEGARKARVMTDTCFTVRPYELIQRQMKFNVIDEAEQTSGTITEYDYTTPGVFLPAVETTVDLTVDEFVYVLGNILRTTRYGKESSRQGFVRNHILALAFSDVELFANLEFTQALYDAFIDDPDIAMVERGLTLADFQKHTSDVIKKLTASLFGRLTLVSGEALDTVLQEMRALNEDEQKLAEFLHNLNTQSASFTV